VTTEAELVLMSMTREEIDDAVRWLGWMQDRWSAFAAESQADRNRVGLATDGPWHLHQAMAMAIVREQVGRGGGTPWDAGMPMDGHPEERALRYYAARVACGPHVGRPSLSDAGVLAKECVLCRRTYPLTADWWTRHPSGLWATQCRPCADPAWRAAQRARDEAMEAVL